jgi:capsular exopolysaccharide synthesis family protein
MVQAVPASPAGMTPADVLRVLRANVWLIAGSIVLAIIVGAIVNEVLRRYYPRYTATGYIQVQPRQFYNPLTKGQETIGDFALLAVELRTQAQLIKQEGLFTRVLQDGTSRIRDTDWFKRYMVLTDSQGRLMPDVSAAKNDLERNLEVNPIQDSKLIRISMTGASPKDNRVIVEEIIDKHLAEQRRQTQELVQGRTSALNNMKSRYQNEINRITNENRSKLADIGNDSLGIVGWGRLSAKELELSRGLESEMKSLSEYNEARQRFETIMQQLQQGIEPPIIETFAADDYNVKMNRQMWEAYETNLAGLTNAGAKSRFFEETAARRDEAYRKYQTSLAEARLRQRNTYVDGLQSMMVTKQREYEQAAKTTASIRGDMQQLSIAYSEFTANKDQLEALRAQVKMIDDQINLIDSTASRSESISAVQWAQRPETPTEPSFPRLPVSLAVAITLGLLLSLGIAFLREVMDTTVRSPRDIAKVGQINVLGTVPHADEDPQATGASLPIVIFHSPTSILAESFRQVRTRLQHAAALDTTRTLMVTSPGAGDGKTTVACNLAAGLALNGRRILLVDSNFRRPELHKIFSVENNAGLSNVLTSLDNFENSIQKTQVPNLDLLTTGPKPSNATEQLESQLLTDFIERALEEYDHVIFDSGPMLLVSETAALAPRVDGVISVVRAAANSRGLLTRMRDALRQVKAEHLGVVLNGVKAQAGGYYNRAIKSYYEYQNGQSN